MTNNSPTTAVGHDPQCQACWPAEQLAQLGQRSAPLPLGPSPPDQPAVTRRTPPVEETPRAHPGHPRARTRAGVTVGRAVRNKKKNVQVARGRDGYDGVDDGSSRAVRCRHAADGGALFKRLVDRPVACRRRGGRRPASPRLNSISRGEKESTTVNSGQTKFAAPPAVQLLSP